jgi:hypothetical protein
MVLAFQNGAKYILVFNSPGNNNSSDFGGLTRGHLDKMQEFWEYAHTHPPVESFPANTAYVLPRDYGYGFRGPDDRIWGKWGPDSLSPVVWADVHHLLDMYVLNLDIVYETKIDDEPIDLPYDTLVFWNRTVIEKWKL